jgi:formylglycine-generating enzyme required for sulfatase activity
MNPTTKPTDTRYLVLRGGCWDFDEPSWVRAASRYSDLPARRNGLIGFRCALRGRSPRV